MAVFDDAVFAFHPGDSDDAPFDIVTTTVAGTSTGSLTTVDGHTGRNYGTGQFTRFTLNVLPTLDPPQDWSICFVGSCPNATDTACFWFGQDDQSDRYADLRVSRSGSVVGNAEFRIDGGSRGGSDWAAIDFPQLSDNDLHLGIATFDATSTSAGTLTGYQDSATAVGTDAFSDVSTATQDRISFGRLDDTSPTDMPGNAYTGLMWDRVLTSGEIDELVAAPFAYLIPSNPAAVDNGADIDLSWDHTLETGGYSIERSPDGVSSWSQIDTVATGVTTYTDVAPGVGEWFYRIKSIFSIGAFDPSDVVSGTVESGTLAGVLFSNPPVFPTGEVVPNQTLTGTVFVNGPDFPVGSVSTAGGAQTITGAVFSNPPVFVAGTVTAGGVTITGVVFSNPPVFPAGSLAPTVVGVVTLTPPGYWLEVWRRPGAANFGKVLDSPPIRESSYHVGVNLLGDGTMSLPDTYDAFDEILDVINEVGSLVRLREDLTGLIIGEWIPSAIVPAADKDDPFVKVSGRGMNEVMGYAVTEAYDWNGFVIWTPNVPDWLWGGDSVLSDGDMENPRITPSIQELRINATGGTYTLSDGVDTTASIAFNASAATIENRLETDIASIVDVVVVQTATNPTTFSILFIDPIVEPLSVNDGSLTGGSIPRGEIEEIQAAEINPSSWQKSSAIVNGLAENEEGYDEFAITNLQNHTPGGTYALRVDPGPTGATSNRNLGAQQVVNVTPGQTYQLGVWIRPTSGTDRFRLGLFTLGEEVVVLSSANGDTLTPNVWNEITINDVVIPLGVDEVLFRIACTNFHSSDPSLFDIDDAYMYEGMQATTVGHIIRMLYEDATVDHVGDGRLVWEDEANPGTPYLTLDFSDSLDSSGAVWANPEVSLKVWMRMTYLQMLEALESQEGIEWRVVPVDPDTGLGGWLLQVYDEGNMDAAPGVVLHGGAQDTRRSLQRFRPASAWLVEAEFRYTARAENATSGFGRIESARLDQTLPPGAGPAERAVAQDKATATVVDDVWTYQLVNPVDAPLVHFQVGDTTTVHDPPEIDDEDGRLWEATLLLTPDAVTWDVDILRPVVE